HQLRTLLGTQLHFLCHLNLRNTNLKYHFTSCPKKWELYIVLADLRVNVNVNDKAFIMRL
ncbi:MAG: hypothetical protein ACREBC_21675, partial [Pyrinomonadaceae bacterium]